MYNEIRNRVRNAENARFTESSTHGATDAVSFGIAQASLTLSDFLWVSTRDTKHEGQPEIDLDEEEISTASVRRYAIERKTYADLAARYGKSDHLKQLRRLKRSSIITMSFFLFEGNLELSARPATYGKHNIDGIQPEIVEAIAVDCLFGVVFLLPLYCT